MRPTQKCKERSICALITMSAIYGWLLIFGGAVIILNAPYSSDCYVSEMSVVDNTCTRQIRIMIELRDTRGKFTGKQEISSSIENLHLWELYTRHTCARRQLNFSIALASENNGAEIALYIYMGTICILFGLLSAVLAVLSFVRAISKTRRDMRYQRMEVL